jgi:hypothetical protein
VDACDFGKFSLPTTAMLGGKRFHYEKCTTMSELAGIHAKSLAHQNMAGGLTPK